jgi:DNA-binding transcriptional LysR family regulator
LTRDLSALQTFVTVAECGGYAEAARRLAISPSMVSRRIARLEAELQVRLIHRTTRGMSLSDAGLRFHERCRALLAELDAACDDIGGDGDGDGVSGSVRITAPQSLLGVALIAPVVARLMAAHPALRFDLALDERKLDLVSGAVEVAVRVGPLPDSRFIARRLAVLQGQMVASSAYLQRHGLPREAADLARHVGLDHSELGPRGLWAMDDSPPPQRVRVNSFEVLLQLVRLDQGIAVLPLFAVQEDLRAGRLQPVLPEWRSVPFELYAVAPPAPRLSARAKVVMDALADYAARPLEEWGQP